MVRCDLLRHIPSLGGFVLSERRDLGLCAGSTRGSRTMANLRRVPLCAVVGSASQSRLKPLPQPTLSVTSYTVIPPPEGEHEESAPPATTAVRRSPPSRLRRITDWREYRKLCHSCTGISSGRYGSRCDNILSRHPSERGSPLTIGSDTVQPRPLCCPCAFGPVRLEGPGTRPASAATVRPWAEEPCD